MFKSAAVLALASAFAAGCASTESDQTTLSAASDETSTRISQASYGVPAASAASGGSSLITLYVHDHVANSFSVDDGEYGQTAHDFGVYNRDSDISFGDYNPGHLCLAKQGRDQAHIINLGTSAELASRYGYGETVGGGQGFSSIEFRDGEITIFEERHESYQPLREADTLINDFDPEQNEIRPEIGHIYLAKIVDRDGTVFVKLYVVAMDPESWIVLRWEKLDPAGAQAKIRGW